MTHRRIELRLADGDELLTELRDEALRGVTLQQHVYDLLRARYLARRGQAPSELLWVPSVPQPPAARLDAATVPPNEAASAAAGAWLDMLDG
jgi:hypothetical protein